MIIAKEKIYTLKINARKIPFWDRFKVVNYNDYRGEESSIPSGYKKIKGTTATIDLTQSMDELLANMNSTTRNEVRRAQKENIVAEQVHDNTAFVAYYNAFAKEKGLPTINETHLTKYGKNLMLAQARFNEHILSMHATMIDDEEHIAGLLYSCSTRLDESVDKKMAGWANRYLHYKEFEMLKGMGMTRYEWCGVCMDPNKPERYSIGQFKLKIGGEIREDLTLHSPLFSLLLRLKGKLNR